jgi:hypothetical protein
VAVLGSLLDPKILEVQVKRSGSAQWSQWLTVEEVENRCVVPVTLKL